MQVEPDFEDFLGLLNTHNVRYCIVGSFALALYAKPRYTKDMDIVVEPTQANARRFLHALAAFGFAALNVTMEDLTRPGTIVQLGYEPVRIDVLTSLEGVSFTTLWRHRTMEAYGRHRVPFIGEREFLTTKRRAGRSQDLADIEAVLRARSQPRRSRRTRR